MKTPFSSPDRRIQIRRGRKNGEKRNDKPKPILYHLIKKGLFFQSTPEEKPLLNYFFSFFAKCGSPVIPYLISAGSIGSNVTQTAGRTAWRLLWTR
jgi:hypothetical protein